MNAQSKPQLITAIASGCLTVILSLSVVGCSSSKSTEELITVLNQRGDGAYSAAIDLGSKKDKRAVEPLIAALQDDSARLRQAALMGLEWLDDPRAIKAIVKALKDKDSAVREEAKRKVEFVIGQNYTSVAPALAQMRAENATTMEPLIALLKEKLKSEGTSSQQRMIAVLGQTKDSRAIEPVLKALDSSDAELRKAAIGALGNMGDKQATEALSRAFAQSSPEEQEAIAIALGTTNQPRAIDALLTAVNKSTPAKQKAAIAGLGRACCKKRKPVAINTLSSIESCPTPRKSGKIRQNPCTSTRENVPKS